MSVTQFPQKPPAGDMIWRCGCGCQSFSIRDDMLAECQHCGEVANDGSGDWRTQLPEPPEVAPQITPADMSVTIIGNDELALRRVLAQASTGETCFVALAQRSGRVVTFGDQMGSQDQIDWLDERLQDVRHMLVPKGGTT